MVLFNLLGDILHQLNDGRCEGSDRRVLSQVQMRADETDEPTAREGDIVQYPSETNSVAHNEQPREPFHEVTQMVQVHGQLIEMDMTGGGSVGARCVCVFRHTYRRYE